MERTIFPTAHQGRRNGIHHPEPTGWTDTLRQIADNSKIIFHNFSITIYNPITYHQLVTDGGQYRTTMTCIVYLVLSVIHLYRACHYFSITMTAVMLLRTPLVCRSNPPAFPQLVRVEMNCVPKQRTRATLLNPYLSMCDPPSNHSQHVGHKRQN